LAARERNDLDDDGYLIAIGDPVKNSGYTEILQLSTSQRSNAHYQDIIDLGDLSSPPHHPVHGTRSLDRDWCDEDCPKEVVDQYAPMRIHKKRDQHLVNIAIPSDSDLIGDVRESCVLSPELMDDGLFESLHNFAKYFTSLSVKKRKEDSECQVEEIITPDNDKDESNDVKETESTDIKTTDAEEKNSSRYMDNEEKGVLVHSNENGLEDHSLTNATPIQVVQNETYQSNGEEREIKELGDSSITGHKEVSSDEEHRTCISPIQHEYNADEDQLGHTSSMNDQSHSSIFIPHRTESMEENKPTMKKTRKVDIVENKHISTIVPSVNKLGSNGTNVILPLKKTNVLFPMTSFDSDHSLNQYVRKNGILLPVKNSPDDKDVSDTLYKRDTI
jgi:hypothetical protein